MGDYNVSIGIVQPRVTDDSLHAADAFTAHVVSILIVVYRKLDEKQINRPFAQDMVVCDEFGDVELVGITSPRRVRGGSSGSWNTTEAFEEITFLRWQRVNLV